MVSTIRAVRPRSGRNLVCATLVSCLEVDVSALKVDVTRSTTPMPCPVPSPGPAALYQVPTPGEARLRVVNVIKPRDISAGDQALPGQHGANIVDVGVGVREHQVAVDQGVVGDWLAGLSHGLDQRHQRSAE